MLTPLRIDLKPSLGLGLSLAFLFIGAGYILSASHLPVNYKVFSLLLFSISFGYYLSRYIFLIWPQAITQVWYRGKSQWLILVKSGHLYSAELLGDSFVSAWLIILNFKTEKKRISVILTRDILNKEQYRKLRMSLSSAGPGFSARDSMSKSLSASNDQRG